MKQHPFAPHPNPIPIPNSFKPQQCPICGVSRYHVNPVVFGTEAEPITMYYRNGRYLGESMPQCVNWQEEDLKKID